MTEFKSVCVYCGSFASAKQVYKDAAIKLGQSIGQAGLTMVFGAGNVGLMGLVSENAIAAGAKVIGISPSFLASREPPNKNLAELLIVEDMHTRKRLMVEKSDAFIILPGGFGTIDELAEIMSWRQLGLHHKPIILVNINGYWDKFRELLEHMLSEGFIKPEHVQLVEFVDDGDQALPAIAASLTRNSGQTPSDGPGPAHGNEMIEQL